MASIEVEFWLSLPRHLMASINLVTYFIIDYVATVPRTGVPATRICPYLRIPYSRVIRRISPISAYPLLGGGFCS